MAKTLQELRKEAGYSSAKDFAKEIGMSESTYSRYESNPDNINMKAAIKLADFLGCSLDMVMGREPVNIEDMRGDVQKFYDSLSPDGKKLFDEFSSFILMREKQAEEDRRNQRMIENLEHFKYYNRLFNAEMSSNKEYFGLLLVSSPRRKRNEFEKFVRERLAEEEVERIKAIDESLVGERAIAKDELAIDYYHTHHTDASFEKEPVDEWIAAKLEEHLQDCRESEIAFMREKNEELVQGVMDAYDSAHSASERGFEYGVVSLED